MAQTELVVFITGASSGIGRATAIEFYRHGYDVVLFARRRERLESLAEELKTLRPEGEVLVIPGDVTHRTEVEKAVQETVRKFGRIDVLVNNAGAGLNAMFESMDPKAFQDVFELNVMGVVHATQAVIPVMKRQQSGQIVNVSSLTGKRALPSRSAYAASKFALEGLSESIRTELAPYEIRISVVRPSTTDTEFFEAEPRGQDFADSTGWPRMSAEIVAREIYRAVRKRKRAVTVSLAGKFFVLANQIAPRLVDWVVLKMFKKYFPAPKSPPGPTPS